MWVLTTMSVPYCGTTFSLIVSLEKLTDKRRQQHILRKWITTSDYVCNRTHSSHIMMKIDKNAHFSKNRVGSNIQPINHFTLSNLLFALNVPDLGSRSGRSLTTIGWTSYFNSALLFQWIGRIAPRKRTLLPLSREWTLFHSHTRHSALLLYFKLRTLHASSSDSSATIHFTSRLCRHQK